jgi:hypothetical protein
MEQLFWPRNKAEPEKVRPAHSSIRRRPSLHTTGSRPPSGRPAPEPKACHATLSPENVDETGGLASSECWRPRVLGLADAGWEPLGYESGGLVPSGPSGAVPCRPVRASCRRSSPRAAEVRVSFANGLHQGKQIRRLSRLGVASLSRSTPAVPCRPPFVPRNLNKPINSRGRFASRGRSWLPPGGGAPGRAGPRVRHRRKSRARVGRRGGPSTRGPKRVVPSPARWDSSTSPCSTIPMNSTGPPTPRRRVPGSTRSTPIVDASSVTSSGVNGNRSPRPSWRAIQAACRSMSTPGSTETSSADFPSQCSGTQSGHPPAQALFPRSESDRRRSAKFDWGPATRSAPLFAFASETRK